MLVGRASVLVGRASVLVGRASVLVGRASVPVYRSHPEIRRRRISGIQTKTAKPGCFMHWCHETTKMGVPPGNSSRGTAGLVPRRT